MKIISKKLGLNFLIAGVLVLMLCSLVSAFGYSSTYTRDKPLIIAPGETKDVQIRLKAGPSEGEMLMDVDLTGGSEVATLINPDLEYTVSSGSDGVVEIRVDVPQDAVEGAEYLVAMLVKDITSADNSGTVPFTITTGASFKVLVQKPAEEEEQPAEISTGWVVLAIVLIIVLIVIIWFVAKSRKPAVSKPGEKPAK